MKIVTTRRISQFVFFCMFIWFCVVTTQGTQWHQLRGWPVNFFLRLDPLVAIGTVLTTHTFYAPLIWSLGTIVVTIIFGRIFCGWICPFGALHHFVGYITNRKKSAAKKLHLNRYRKAQCIKYFVLIFFLVSAATSFFKSGSLQTGLLDPICLASRSVNIVLLPIVDSVTHTVSATPRYYQYSWLILTVFFAAIFMNTVIPRFYCRFICPLGGLLGLLSRFSIWRIGKNVSECSNCGLCEKACEGGCEPASQVRIAECVSCFNCLDDCRDDVISYQTSVSAAGEVAGADISRRGFVLSLTSGIFAIPAVRLAGKLAANWHYKLIRPPGSLDEAEFLKRCIKCGQCMRICPTNVIQPGGAEMGLEALWTPVMNNRIGSSGCELNCTECGNICPTSAIRPISLTEKKGLGEFVDEGPIKIGTAFVDRSRCLPWVMDKPCIVCQENCPLSPKAIYTQEYFSTIRDGRLLVVSAGADTIQISGKEFSLDSLATGDYYCLPAGLPEEHRSKITANMGESITVSPDRDWPTEPKAGSYVLIQVRLQRPYIDVDKCIGCGVCEHECPVAGKRAIRVSAEGETRSADRNIFLRK